MKEAYGDIESKLNGKRCVFSGKGGVLKHPFRNGICHGLGTQAGAVRQGNVFGVLALGQHGINGGMDGFRCWRKTAVIQQHGQRQYLRNGIKSVQALKLRCRAVAGFK